MRGSRSTAWPWSTGSAGWRLATPACLSPSVLRIAPRPLMPADLPSILSKRRCPSGRRSSWRTAKFLRHLQFARNLHHNKQMKIRPRKMFVAGPALLGLFVSTSVVKAQEKPDRPPWAQPSSSPNAQAPAGEAPAKEKNTDTSSPKGTVKVNVNFVNVLVSVLDDHNRPAPNLPVEAFQIFEEGVQQNVAVFEPETKQPLDLALMLDASLSERQEMASERDAACHFIQQVLRPDDRLSVFGFDESVTQMAPFSSNVGSLQSAVRRIPDGAGTSIYDAVLLGSKALEKRSAERRRVIIMVTDAGETTSRSDFESARKSALPAG